VRIAAPRGAIASALLGTVSPALAMNLRALWDAANNGWNQWVLNYTQGKQLNLLRNMGFESPSWADLSYLLIGIVVLASLSGVAWTLWERSRQDPWLRLLARAAVHLKKTGLSIALNSPPRRMAEQLLAQRDPHDPRLAAWADWLLRLEVQRYAAIRTQRGSLATLKRELKQLMHR
jgi:hypothetical protein